jgi:hypothetical protein
MAKINRRALLGALAISAAAPGQILRRGGGFSTSLTGSAGGQPPVGERWTLPTYAFDASIFPSNLTFYDMATGAYATNYTTAKHRNTGTRYYVRADGNDTTGNGLTAATAWRTLQKAHDSITAADIIDVGPGLYPPASFTKKVDLRGPGKRLAFVGDFLDASAVTVGPLTSGRQLVTINAGGYIDGFVDLSRNKGVDRENDAVPQVSNKGTLGQAAAFQAANDAGINPATGGSTLFTSDGRDISGQIGTQILIWPSTARAPVTLANNVDFVASGISFVGGLEVAALGTGLLATDSVWSLGCAEQAFTATGVSPLRGKASLVRTWARGLGPYSTGDIIDISQADAFNLLTGCDQGSINGSDQGYTGHAANDLTIDCNFVTASSGFTGRDGRSILLNSTISGGTWSIRAGNPTVNANHELHMANVSLVGTPSQADVAVSTGTTISQARVYDYTKSTQGKVTTGRAIVDRSGLRPTDERIFFALHPTNLAKLAQNADGTGTVAANGDPVRRVGSDDAGPNYLLIGTSGTSTYNTDGTRSWITLTGCRPLLQIVEDSLEQACDIIVAVKSTDKSFFLLNYQSTLTTNSLDFRSSSALPTKGDKLGAPTYHVDGSDTPLTSATALTTALCDGNAHILTIRNVDLSYPGWFTPYFLSGPVAGTNSFDGQFYSIEIRRVTNAAGRKAREQFAAAAVGATLVA